MDRRLHYVVGRDVVVAGQRQAGRLHRDPETPAPFEHQRDTSDRHSESNNLTMPHAASRTRLVTLHWMDRTGVGELNRCRCDLKD
ncbi:unnamed protein product [Colias eurytheme]|nr:unnamed protein product [Colias eurytheme]